MTGDGPEEHFLKEFGRPMPSRQSLRFGVRSVFSKHGAADDADKAEDGVEKLSPPSAQYLFGPSAFSNAILGTVLGGRVSTFRPAPEVDDDSDKGPQVEMVEDVDSDVESHDSEDTIKG